MKLTGRQVERIALPHLEVSVLRSGLQLATPTIDTGIDAIVFSTDPKFRARPIQLKSYSGRGWSLYAKYGTFDRLLMAYVWRALEPDAEVFIMTYEEALQLAKTRGYTKTNSWKRIEVRKARIRSDQHTSRIGPIQGTATFPRDSQALAIALESLLTRLQSRILTKPQALFPSCRQPGRRRPPKSRIGLAKENRVPSSSCERQIMLIDRSRRFNTFATGAEESCIAVTERSSRDRRGTLNRPIAQMQKIVDMLGRDQKTRGCKMAGRSLHGGDF